MAQVTISFNGRSYRFECADAEAERLEKLARYLKDKLDTLIGEHGAIGDERLVLMAALMLTDELFEARADIDQLLGEGPRMENPGTGEPAGDAKALREAVDVQAGSKT